MPGCERADHAAHGRAVRALAAEHFDAARVLPALLESSAWRLA